MGDLHIENFGAFDLDDGTIVYELNDFDESTVTVNAGHVHDVVKLAASVILASTEMKVSAATARALAERIAGEYADAVQDFAKAPRSLPDETFWTASKKTDGKLKSFLERVSKASAKDARKAMLDKFTVKSSGVRKFKANSPDLRLLTSSVERARVTKAVAEFVKTVESSLPTSNPKFFDIIDIAVRLFAGTGSQGKLRYYVLVRGASSDADAGVILDVKMQGEWPAPLLFASQAERAAHRALFANEGLRHAVAYKAHGSSVDDTLGYAQIVVDAINGTAPFWFSVRQRSPFKATFPYAELKDDTSDWEDMCNEWAQILATHHCRADSRFRDGQFAKHNFAVALDALVSGNMDSFVRDIADLAQLTADTAKKDYAVFKRDNGVTAQARMEFEEPQPEVVGDDDATVASSSRQSAASLACVGLIVAIASLLK
jgi:uncharacterized protein (DUF2252 family)